MRPASLRLTSTHWYDHLIIGSTDKRRGCSRRMHMRSGRNWTTAVALGATLISGAALSACGGTKSNSSDATAGVSSGSTANTSAGTPKRGGTLTFARSLDAEAGLNSINAPNNGSIFTIQQVFDQLVEVDGDKLVPGLAEKWEHSADGLTWTFHLRDAQFSDGSPVTAGDVKFSIERFANPKINTNYATLGSSIKQVDVVDPHTAKIRLKS